MNIIYFAIIMFYFFMSFNANIFCMYILKYFSVFMKLQGPVLKQLWLIGLPWVNVVNKQINNRHLSLLNNYTS